MIAIAMYIMLGVFVTLLLTLFVLPLIWRRAVRLTEKRMMAEMPISYSELQAEKDMQRAEQAIELRRLEVTADSRLEEMANQSLKIDRLKNTIEERESEIASRQADIAALEDALTTSQQETAQTSQTLTTTSSNLEDAKQTITEIETAKSDVEEELLHLETSFSEQKIELIAQSTRIENYKEEISELTGLHKTEARQRAEAESSLSQKTAEVERNKERLEKQQEKLDSLQSDVADMDASIANLNLQLDRSKARNSEADPETTQKLASAEARRVEAEAKVASLTLQVQHGMNAESAKELTALVDSWQNEKNQLENKLADAVAESEALNKKLAKQKKKSSESENTAALSPKEMLLRNEIKNIAAQITGFTAQSEGNTSVIHTLLGDDATDASHANGNDDTPIANTMVSGVSDPNAEFVAPVTEGLASTEEQEGPKDAWDEVFSLADRIRNMTNNSEDKNVNP